MNVTAIEPTAESFVTVWPSGSNRPNASSLNLAPGVTRPNLVTAQLGAGGRVSIYNNEGATHVIADIVGWFPGGAGAYTGLNPARILDTRNGIGAPAGALGQDGEIVLQVAGRGGVPAGASAAVLNVTVAEPSDESFVTVWPADAARPNASSLNMTAGQTVPNLVVTKLSADGKIRLYNNRGNTELIADVVGWLPAGTFKPLQPARILDTRNGIGTTASRVGPAGEVVLQVTGRGGVPAGASAAVLNVTVTEPTDESFVTVWPADAARPNASSLNMTAGQTVPNLVVTKLSADGRIRLYNNRGNTELIADVVGWLTT